MPQPPDLRHQAFAFARDTSELLNGTVTDGIRVRAVVGHDGAIGWMGYGINAVDDLPGELIPLTLGRSPNSFLHIIHTLTLDEAGEYLQATKSSYGVYVGSASLDEADLLVRYDYEREPDHPYADAHMQVRGKSSAVQLLNERFEMSSRSRSCISRWAAGAIAPPSRTSSSS